MAVSEGMLKFVRQSMKIDGRYDRQDMAFSANGHFRRREWTSKQKKRMRKQKNKYRTRFLGSD